jgi:hypothetical protein
MRDATSRLLQSEFWKSHLLCPDTPRKGDKAAIVKDHRSSKSGCTSTETGALVKVTNDPILGRIRCTDCQGLIDDWVVEIMLLDDLGREPPEGAYLFAYPVAWLQRILPLGHEDASQKQVLTLA